MSKQLVGTQIAYAGEERLVKKQLFPQGIMETSKLCGSLYLDLIILVNSNEKINTY